jgi:hypothetical protein
MRNNPVPQPPGEADIFQETDAMMRKRAQYFASRRCAPPAAGCLRHGPWEGLREFHGPRPKIGHSKRLARRISPISPKLLGWERFFMHLADVAGNVQRVPNEPVPLKRHPQGVTGGHTYSDILKELDRLRNSKAMKGCSRLLQLVTFVVEATLKGEQGHLKETTIGVFVFGRSPDYNPKVDTIVRSQAWRLRAKLKAYYASEGLHDPVIIDLPVGQYVPVFRRGCRNCD